MLLLKTVIEGMFSFWAQIFVLLKKLLEMVGAKCRAFLWVETRLDFKRALVAWDQVYRPKCFGGLCLKNIFVWNKVALLKQLWSIVKRKERLWVLWVHEYYIKH